MMQEREMTDSFGAVRLPADALWGVATARSLQFFAIGEQRMPLAIIHALAGIKWAAARVNGELGLLPPDKAQAIANAACRVAAGEFDHAFPLSLWQTGSGTQSNMNVNEVVATLAGRALLAAGVVAGGDDAGTCGVDANDEVNRGQSSNDVFPAAMHLALALQVRDALLPALAALQQSMRRKAQAFAAIIKIGRTHMQDATPLTFGQEFGGYVAQLALCQASIEQAQGLLHALAIGGTAVGTGLNTHPEFARRVLCLLALDSGLPLTQAPDLFAAMAGHEALVAFHGSLKMLAIALLKIGNDLRLMGSGPRAGLGELQLPQNEAGSSIMPGKVNPTQIEALCMVCAQVMGHDVAIGFAASQGQFELNVYKPLLAHNALDSLRLLTDAMSSFRQHCLDGIEVNHARVAHLLQSSLMLVTALTPHIGYARAGRISQHAQQHNISLREAALALGMVTAEEFERWVDPRLMLGPHA